MSTWRIVLGQLSGRAIAVAASLPQGVVAHCGLVPSRSGLRGGRRVRGEGGDHVGEDVADLVAHRQQDHHDHDRHKKAAPREKPNREPDGDAGPAAGTHGWRGGRYPGLSVPSPRTVLRISGTPAGAVPPPEAVGRESHLRLSPGNLAHRSRGWGRLGRRCWRAGGGFWRWRRTSVARRT